MAARRQHPTHSVYDGLAEGKEGRRADRVAILDQGRQFIGQRFGLRLGIRAIVKKHFFGTFILTLTNFGTFVTYRSEAPVDRAHTKFQGGTAMSAIIATSSRFFFVSARRRAYFSKSRFCLDRARRGPSLYRAL